MKTILIPTDYSDAAANAMNYAVKLAKFEGAKIILFNSYHVRTLLSSLTLFDGGFKEENLERLGKIKWEIQQEPGNGGLQIEIISERGFALDTILDVIQEKKVDMVIMGLRGENVLSEVLVGNTTTSLLQKTTCPVLAIPLGVKFMKPESLLMLYDMGEGVPEKIMDRIKEFLILFNAKILLMNVVTHEQQMTVGEGAEDVEYFLENSLGEVEHEVFSYYSEDLLTEINSFVDECEADMLVMIPHSKGFLERIFQSDETEKIVLNTKIPILSIHD